MLNTSSKNTLYNSQDKLLQIFLRDVRKHSGMPHEEQKAMVLKAQKGDRSARDRVILANMGFVTSMAKHMCNEDFYNDLINEGVFGLNKAIEKYDPAKNSNFLTYAAYWIRAAMMDFLAAHSALVTPKNNAYILKYTPKFKRKFFQENGRDPTTEELLAMFEEKKLKIPPAAALSPISFVSASRPPTDPEKEGQYSLYCEYERCSSSDNVTQSLDKMDTSTIFRLLTEGIDQDCLQIVKWRFGVEGESLSFSEIGRRLDITSTTAKRKFDATMRQLEDKAEKLTDQIS